MVTSNFLGGAPAYPPKASQRRPQATPNENISSLVPYTQSLDAYTDSLMAQLLPAPGLESDLGLHRVVTEPDSATSFSLKDTSTDVLVCPFQDCAAQFTGEYRKGNLGRHRRQKHAGQVLRYPCHDKHCTRVFQRKDARLKHYRKAHPDLAVEPLVSGKTSSSTGSDWGNTDSDFPITRIESGLELAQHGLRPESARHQILL